MNSKKQQQNKNASFNKREKERKKEKIEKVPNAFVQYVQRFNSIDHMSVPYIHSTLCSFDKKKIK